MVFKSIKVERVVVRARAGVELFDAAREMNLLSHDLQGVPVVCEDFNGSPLYASSEKSLERTVREWEEQQRQKREVASG